jgi:hypothetical protein
MILGNRFAPITFRIGFIQAGLDNVLEQYVRWNHIILRTVSKKPIDGALSQKLEGILPLDDMGQRLLFTSTKSSWVAIFDNGFRGGQTSNTVAVVSERLNTLGLMYEDVPNTFSKSNRAEAKGAWGLLALAGYGVTEHGIWGINRGLRLQNDVSGWEFHQKGKPWPFESVERYETRRTTRRIDRALMVSYLAEFGIRVYEDEFYYGPGVATNSRSLISPRAKRFELREIQRQMRIEVG